MQKTFEEHDKNENKTSPSIHTHTIQKLIASECSTLNKFKNSNSVNHETKYNNKISNEWKMKPRNQTKI